MATEQSKIKDRFYVEFEAPNASELRALIKEAPLDIIEVSPVKDDVALIVHALLDEEQIEQVKKHCWKMEVGKNFSEIGRERQKEVGKGDRFNAGKVVPQGLAKKGVHK